jgi:hypothetical protein
VPAWIFPFVFLYGGLAADKIGHPLLFFWLIAAPLFFWSFARASSPWRRKEVGYWSGVFWSMVVPFLLWALAILSRFAIMGLVGGAHAA